ncbi:glutathione S-transferase [Halteromyces radiatus]|uniref:glutathione S-transferase n=1 Tax=Halteromyces radiatus TaxID=101107 RepID=UPI00221FEBA6|nr:glutathione S-transferase [Halteromyces radiatus]KAI8097776.1 glutathione S-transferase [Halteromyces radiatus]
MASEESKPILYNYFRSSASYRVRIALAWKGIDYEYREISLLTGTNESDEYLKVNPFGKVPAFVTKDGKVLVQSEAIMDYLEEIKPERPMLPKGAIHRAQVRAIVQAIACDIHPLQNLAVLKHVAGDDVEKRTEWANYWINKGFTGLETMLEQTAGTYCLGDHITMADMFLVPMVQNAHRWKVDMKPFPLITRINNTLLTLPEFKSAHPFNQPDCPDELKKNAP